MCSIDKNTRKCNRSRRTKADDTSTLREENASLLGVDKSREVQVSVLSHKLAQVASDFVRPRFHTQPVQWVKGHSHE